MIDTHSHLLHGVDHGCPDLQTSVQMAREAASSGIGTVVCTPHLKDPVPEDLTHAEEAIEQLRAEIAKEGMGLRLLLGFELDLTTAATCSLEELKTLTVEGSQGAMILEMPYQGWPRFLEETLFRLSTWGFQPVLAHPERNDRVQRSPELLAGCLRAGAVVQATAASLTGEFGRAAGRAFGKLLAEGFIGLLASDAHAYRTDDWTLANVIESLRGTVSDEGLSVLVEKNPQRLLAGQSLLKVRPEVGGSAKTWRSWR